MTARRERLLLAACLAFAAGVFLTGITWGLPSREADSFLFGSHARWTGPHAQVLTDVGGKPWDDPNRGADVDADPLAKTGQLVVVNADDGSRAEIFRRYRLFTHQPDEMITFMSLAKMKPGQFDFDPKLYQYGGLWVYPVGLLLKAASAVRYVELRPGAAGVAYYLDHPDAFGRFYVVARLYVVGWGVLGAWAIYALVRRITGGAWAAAGAAVAFAVMPVVLNMAHEAKPHLPGMVLVLLAVLAGARYVETGRLADAVAAGVACGCALAMVLSTLPVFSVLLLMVLLRPGRWGDRAQDAFLAGSAGLAVYGVTNPYVIYHLLRGGGALKSNLGNSTTFYSVGHVGEGLVNVGRLMAEGASPVMLAAGLIGTVLLAIRAVRVRHDGSPAEVRRRAHGLLLAGPAVLTAVQAALVAAGKPGEFGRFLLLTDVFLLVEAFATVGTITSGRWKAGGNADCGMRNAECERAAGTPPAALQPSAFSLQPFPQSLPPAYRERGPALPILLSLLLVAGTAFFGWPYLRGFVRDASPETSRLVAAREVERLRQAGGKRLLLTAEPAPYAVPPVNLFEWPLVLVPKGSRPEAFALPGDVVVEVREGGAPISWADKPIDVRAVP
jgi:hypothetical protein